MNRRTTVAVVVQVAIMLTTLAAPLWVRSTGTEVWLETAPVDPRALFRGDYVILGYRVAEGALTGEMSMEAQRTGRPIYVTVTTARPATLVAIGLERPRPGPGQACLIGRARGFTDQATVDFPQIAQFFVPEGTGRAIEAQRGENLLARVAVSGRCNAVLLDLEPR